MVLKNILSILQKYDLRPVIIVVIIFLTASLLVPVTFLMGFVLYHEVYGLVYPGVKVAGVDIGGLTVEQASNVLDAAWNVDRRLLIQSDQQVWRDSPLAFGLWMDVGETAEKAHKIGRGPDAAIEWTRILVNKEVAIDPVVQINLDLARERLEDVAFLINDTEAGNQIRFVSDKWEIASESGGRTFDTGQTLLNMASRPDLILLSGILTLSYDVAEEKSLIKSPGEQEALDMLNSDLKIRAYDPIRDEFYERSFAPEETSRWVNVQNTNGEPEIQVNWDIIHNALQNWISSLPYDYEMDLVRNPDRALELWGTGRPITVLLRHSPTTYIVQSGDTLLSIAAKTEIPYWRIVGQNPGLAEDNLSAGMELTIPSKNELLPLPIVMGKRIEISISQQRMRVFEDGTMIKEFIISTGISRSPTASGVFQVQTHELNAYASIWDLYMPHFLGIYEAAPDFMNGIHGLPMLSSGQRLWENVLGTPASYGCIILDLEDAEYLYNWAENGVVVEIHN